MLSFVDLAASPEFTVSSVDCHDDHRGWSAEQPRADVRLVLVRRGGFRRRVRGITTDLDPTVGYLGLPGEEEHFAHPAGGDVCTSISLTPHLWRTMAGDTPRLDGSSLYIDARLDLAHRRLLAHRPALAHDHPRATADDESLVGLVAAAIHQLVATTTPDTGTAGDRALVGRAREVIGNGGGTTLISLADLLGVSLTRYRNRVRVARALDRLEAGEPSLAALAADLGFADQAHLCRTVREHVGHTPTALRRLLA
ncbi:helix-turn-helix domain-containing protein [Lentzea alba]|uniref:helix-turn-helix transcriptional regulator n=1 Tax=Lentzea alba TaxID=2714351 RepID=UPI0039BFDCA0